MIFPEKPVSTFPDHALAVEPQEVEIICRDSFLISYGLKSRNDRCVVTNEISKPGKQRANRKVPDVCNQMQVAWMDSFGLIRALDFSTSWRAAAGV